MSYPVSVQAILTRALQRSNLEGATQFITQTEQIDLLNVSLAEWYDLVRLTTWGGQYFRAPPYTFTTLSNVTSYALPPDFLSLLSVDIFLSSTWKVNGRPFQEEERNVYTGPTIPVGWTYGLPIWYQLQAGNIVFLTNPSSIYQIGLNYVPTAPQFGDPNDTLDCVNGWEEWIVLDIAQKFLLKDGQLDALGAIANMQEKQRIRIVSAVPNRDMGAAEIVHDLVGEDMGFEGGFGGSFP